MQLLAKNSENREITLHNESHPLYNFMAMRETTLVKKLKAKRCWNVGYHQFTFGKRFKFEI